MTRQSAELRSPEEARAFLLQSVWLQRIGEPDAHSVRETIAMAGRIIGEGLPLLPLGILADVSRILTSPGSVINRRVSAPGLLPKLMRDYEDHVLGRLSIDLRFDRAASALRRYETDDRPKALAFALRQWQTRWNLGGVELSPAWLRTLLGEDPHAMFQEGRESLESGPHPLLLASIEEILRAARRAVDTLAAEDVLALEQRMALADYSQFVAHRQLLQQTSRLEAALPVRMPKPVERRREAPTRLRDEDHYPVGGYASIGTRGSVESLMHSQLAYMEDHERPDLFDVKFVRDELFYYTRDENQFLRRRRAYGIHFAGDLKDARVKDPDQPVQRIILAAALVLALVRRLCDWLSRDALEFAISFDPALEPEADLFRVLLIDEIRRGIVQVFVTDQPQPRWHELARASQFRGVVFTTMDSKAADAVIVDAESRLILDGIPVVMEGDAWSATLLELLKAWL